MQGDGCLQHDQWESENHEYYYGILVYVELKPGGSRFEANDERTMKVTTEKPSNLANRLPEMTKDRKMVRHSVWIALASSWAMLYGNTGRYVLENEVAGSEKMQTEQKNIVEFYHMESPSSEICYRSNTLLVVCALQKLKYGEDLFV